MIDRYGTSENIFGELVKGKLISQVFLAKHNYLRAVSFEFATYMRRNKCNIFFELTYKGKILVNKKIKANLIKDNSFYEIVCDVDLVVGNVYEVKLHSDGHGGNAVTPKFGKPVATTCIYQIVTNKIVDVRGCDCHANVIDCNSKDKDKSEMITTRDCKRDKCRHFTFCDDSIDGLWMRVNGRTIKGQLCTLFHYGKDGEDSFEDNVQVYDAIGDSKDKINLSIVIPTALRIDHLKRCLDSIRVNTKCSYEVIVIINSPSSSFEESVIKLLSLYKNHSYYIFPGFSGYVKTCNLGAKKSVGKYICIMNDDVIVGKSWVEDLCRPLKDKSIGQTAPGKLAYVDNNFNLTDIKNKARSYIEGWCFIIPRWIYEEIGLFDNKLKFAYCEDSDFSRNIISNGYKVVTVPKAKIKHLQTQTAHDSKLKKISIDSELTNKKYLKGKWPL